MKKGFTLVEILAVIVLLGVLGIIAFISVDKILGNNADKTYDVQLNNIIDSAKVWASNNVFELPSEEGEYIFITLRELKEEGLVSSKITNPKTNQEFDDNLQVKITVKDNNYEYSIVE